MKKFLLCMLALALAVLVGYYVEYYAGISLPWDGTEDVTAPFRTQGEEFQYMTEAGDYAPITFRGVDIYASLPGYAHSQFQPHEEDYLRWFGQIADMGANLLRVTSIMDDAFYNALYTHNTTHDTTLYLLQGMSVSDRANAGPEDAYSDEFFQALVNDGRTLVDVIHGRKNIPLNAGEGSGNYRRDVSEWVMGYLVGTDWNAGTVAYTDHRAIHPTQFSGQYFTTGPEASRFETLMAQVMERIAAYEVDKYSHLRPMSFIVSPSCDFLVYDDNYADQLNKYAYIDPEHVLATEKNVAGVFASYRVYDLCEKYLECLCAEQRAELAASLAAIEPNEPYSGYLRIIGDHHTMPLMVASYGFSTARTPIRSDRGPLTEEQQGQALMWVYEEAMEQGWDGVCINSWQDRWELRTWNTAYSSVLQRNYMWHDLQCDNQNYGLMAFEPGKEPVCLVDGDPSEWTELDLVIDRPFGTLSARYDAEGLYLMIQGEGVSPEELLYVPIDSTPITGSENCAGLPMSFSRAADFLLVIHGEEHTRMLVQERYDGMRQNFGMEVEMEDPFIHEPAKESNLFGPMQVVTENDYLLSADQRLHLSAREQRELQLMTPWEAGKLVHGNGDPASEDYNSLADMCFGDGCVEIRIPWELLNVGDPSELWIHDDYYEHYGVEMRRSKGLHMGLLRSNDAQNARMGRFSWKKWKTVDYRERLKESYQVVQDCWR